MFYWLLVIPLLLPLILAHEWGHFLAARITGVQVLEFGLGFRPRALALGRRNGVLYTLNWLPIGGFVLLAGENDAGIPNGLASKNPWQRGLVLAGGAAMNLVLAFLLCTGLALVPREATIPGRIGIIEIMPGGPADQAGLQARDILLRVEGRPALDENVLLDLALRGGQETEVVVERAGAVLTLTVIPSVTPFSGVDHLGIGRYLHEAPEAALASVIPGKPAYTAGLRSDDVVLSVDGHPVQNNLDFWETLSQRRQALADTPAGVDRTVVFVVRRDGQVLPPITIHLPPPEAADQALGLGWAPPTYLLRRTVPQALAQGARDTVDAVVLVPRILWAIARGSVPVQDLAGPVGMAQAVDQVARSSGVEGVVRFAALLSANLFVVNLLPLPALDGGHLFFVLLELLRGGRRIPSRVEARIHRIGMFVLIAFLALVTIFDLLRLFPRPAP